MILDSIRCEEKNANIFSLILSDDDLRYLFESAAWPLINRMLNSPLISTKLYSLVEMASELEKMQVKAMPVERLYEDAEECRSNLLQTPQLPVEGFFQINMKMNESHCRNWEYCPVDTARCVGRLDCNCFAPSWRNQ